MGRSFKTSLTDSMSDFQNYIRPVLEKALVGQLIPVEGNTVDHTAFLLDALAGIDMWYVDKDIGMKGVASRIQRGRSWRTFTIRAERESGIKTEYEKRKNAMDNGWLYPSITYQAYIDGDRVSLGMAYTKDIFACIEQGLCYTQQTGSQQKGQARFYVVKWDDMKNKGYKLCELDYLVDSQKRA